MSGNSATSFLPHLSLFYFYYFHKITEIHRKVTIYVRLSACPFSYVIQPAYNTQTTEYYFLHFIMVVGHLEKRVHILF